MIRLAAIALMTAGFAARAAELPAPDISPPDSWEPRQTGTLHVLNKLDSTVATVTLKVGETRAVESLTITLSGCFVRPTDLPADATAHLAIVDRRAATNAGTVPGFSGWMLHNEPALNLLEHPVYDVQLVSCS